MQMTPGTQSLPPLAAPVLGERSGVAIEPPFFPGGARAPLVLLVPPDTYVVAGDTESVLEVSSKAKKAASSVIETDAVVTKQAPSVRACLR